MNETLSTITEAIKTGRGKEAMAATQTCIDAGDPPETVLSALMEGMDDVGRRFKADEIFVPEVLVSARAMKKSMELLEPHLAAAGIKQQFTAVIGTVEGDLHDIGKNLVTMMWKGANFKVIDLGTNVSPEQFVEAARVNDAQLIGLSSLLTTTMASMKEAVRQIRESGLADTCIIVGGAPITEAFAREIGADGYARDAAAAVDIARELVGTT